MYLARNRRNRNTCLALVGKGIILQPKGKKGDSALLLDREISDPDVKAKRAMKAISLERVADKPSQAPPPKADDEPEKPKLPDAPPDAQVVPDDHHTARERTRVDHHLAAEDRAATRNAAAATRAKKRTSKKKGT